MQQRRQRLSGVDDIQARAPRVGKLKIGEMKENARGVTYPSKLDYIVAKDGAGNRIESFHSVYGDKPTEFVAVLTSNDLNDIYWEAYRRYGSGTGLACHGDGHNAIVEATGETCECPCAFAEPTIKNDKEYPPACKVVASLSLWLYEVPELGIFQIDTGGFRSVSNLKWFLKTGLPGLTGGQIAGIPVRVYMEPFQAMHDGKASIAYQWKLGLVPGMKPADAREAAAKAVEGFVTPIVGRALDEAKPEDLYAGIPAQTGESPERATIPGTSEWKDRVDTPSDEPPYAAEWEPIDDSYNPLPDDVQALELRFLEALAGSGWPEAKRRTVELTMERNRSQALDEGTLPGYGVWLEQQTGWMPRGDA